MDLKDLIAVIVIVFGFFGSIVGGTLYTAELSHQCKIKALEKNVTPAEIEILCRR